MRIRLVGNLSLLHALRLCKDLFCGFLKKLQIACRVWVMSECCVTLKCQQI